jgi:hypothetical protein
MTAFFFAQLLGQQQVPSEGPPPLPFPEVAAPPVILSPLPWWWFVLGFLVLALAFWGLIKLLLGGKAVIGTPVRRPLQSALRALRELRAGADQLSPADVGHRVSYILREYYQQRYGIPAINRTSEELFPSQLAISESMRRTQWREKFGPLAPEYDALAYGPMPTTSSEAYALMEKCISRLESEIGGNGEEVAG